MRMIARVMVWVAALAFAGCNAGPDSGSLTGQSALAADLLRKSNVEATLEMLYEVADRIAPLAEALDLAQAGALAAAADALLLPAGFRDTRHRIVLDEAWNGDADTRYDLVLEYVDAGGLPVREPISGGALWISFTATGGRLLGGAGMLHVSYDALRGLVVRGDLGAEFPNGSAASVTVEELAGRIAADLDARGAGFLAQSGAVAVWVHSPISGEVRGRAALVGREAQVYLRIGSVVGEGVLRFER